MVLVQCARQACLKTRSFRCMAPTMDQRGGAPSGSQNKTCPLILNSAAAWLILSVIVSALHRPGPSSEAQAPPRPQAERPPAPPEVGSIISLFAIRIVCATGWPSLASHTMPPSSSRPCLGCLAFHMHTTVRSLKHCASALCVVRPFFASPCRVCFNLAHTQPPSTHVGNHFHAHLGLPFMGLGMVRGKHSHVNADVRLHTHLSQCSFFTP